MPTDEPRHRPRAVITPAKWVETAQLAAKIKTVEETKKLPRLNEAVDGSTPLDADGDDIASTTVQRRPL